MAYGLLVRRRLLWVCVFFLFACNSVQRAMVVLAKHPVEASQFCGSNFPSKDTTIIKEEIKYDTIWQINPTEIDTIYKNDTTIITITSPSKTIYKTVYKIKEVIKEPTQKIEEQRRLYVECQGRYATTNQKLEVANAERKYWKERFFWLLLVACALAGYIVRKPVARIISKFPI